MVGYRSEVDEAFESPRHRFASWMVPLTASIAPEVSLVSRHLAKTVRHYLDGILARPSLVYSTEVLTLRLRLCSEITSVAAPPDAPRSALLRLPTFRLTDVERSDWM